MTEQRTTKAPVEEVLLFTIQQLTENAYERFTQGEVSQAQLKELYGALSNWTRASEQVFETINRLGIRT
jgi:hypothetical protein